VCEVVEVAEGGTGAEECVERDLIILGSNLVPINSAKTGQESVLEQFRLTVDATVGYELA
jgi:hypothetical protein